MKRNQLAIAYGGKMRKFLSAALAASALVAFTPASAAIIIADTVIDLSLIHI